VNFDLARSGFYGPGPSLLMTPSSRSRASAPESSRLRGGFQLRQPPVAVKILCGVMHKYEIQSVPPQGD